MRLWLVGDVITADVVSVREDTPYRQRAELLTVHRINAVPVVAAAGLVVGIVADTDLLLKVQAVESAPAILVPGRIGRSPRRGPPPA